MAEVRTREPVGLITTERVPVPLAGVSIEAEISAFCARVSVAQRYLNREAKPIEAVYLFPLDEGAAVCGFEAVVDGTLVVGEVRERGKAFEEYDDALARGDGAFLLDEERPDVFRASVGNLPPGREAVLRITYVTELSVDGNGLRFAIPTTVAPRYGDNPGVVGETDAALFDVPRALQVPYGLNLSVRLAMPGAITRLESPSHPISVAVTGATGTVTLGGRETALDRDFVLAVEAEGLAAPQAWVERNDGEREAIAVGFVPALPGRAAASEVVFVVDRSGSMDGTSIEEVRNALQLCLRSLLPGSWFNIVGFGSSVDPFGAESRPYDDRSLEEASRYVAAMEADLGGTEILPALEFVLRAPPQQGLPRQLVVLTDGEVTNTDAVIALARRHHERVRIFTFGIGAGASHHLVKGLARAGGGAAEFIHPGERIEPKVMRQFARLSTPALTDARIAWGGLRVRQAPAEVPPVFAGSRFLVYALVEKRVTATTVRLEAVVDNQPIVFEVPVDPARGVAGRAVTTLAARARIRELEESATWAGARGSQQQDRQAAAISREITELAIEYGLMSRQTSYVAIERRDTPVEGEVQLRKVPIALTTGWGGVGRVRRIGAQTPDTAVLTGRAPTAARAMFQAESAPPASAMGLAAPEGAAIERLVRSVRRIGPASRAHAPSRAAMRMHAVISLQRADGSWQLTEGLADAIGAPLASLESEMPGGRAASDDARAWATALAVAWLGLHAAGQEDEWRMIAEKARRWLDRHGALGLLAKAEEFLRAG